MDPRYVFLWASITAFVTSTNTQRNPCPAQKDVPNGIISPYTPNDIYDSSDTVTLQCAHGFTLEGLSSTTCQANGQWSSELGECKKTETNTGGHTGGLGIYIGIAVGVCVVFGLVGLVVKEFLWTKHTRNQPNTTPSSTVQTRQMPYSIINAANGPGPDGLQLQGTVAEEANIFDSPPSLNMPSESGYLTPTGRDMVQPYMVKVFQEAYYVNEVLVPPGRMQDSNDRVCQEMMVGPPPYMTIIGSDADECPPPVKTRTKPTAGHVSQEPHYANEVHISAARLTQTKDTTYDDTALPVQHDSKAEVYEYVSGAIGPICPVKKDDVQEWLKVNYVSQDTCCTLQKEMIRKKADLKLMTKDDIQGLGLPLGEQLRLRECVEKLHRGEGDTTENDA